MARGGRLGRGTWPFLFLGQGFSTSRKCVEGLAWFSKVPTAQERRRIAAGLPEPVAVIHRWKGPVLHFGSDDLLEARVRASFARRWSRHPFREALDELCELGHREGWSSRDYVPTRAEWMAFCQAIERWAKAAHRVCPLLVVVKSDDGRYGQRLGSWHRWSVKRLRETFSDLPLAKIRPSCVFGDVVEASFMTAFRDARDAAAVPREQRT